MALDRPRPGVLRFLRGYVKGTDPRRGDDVDNTDVYRLMMRTSGVHAE